MFHLNAVKEIAVMTAIQDKRCKISPLPQGLHQYTLSRTFHLEGTRPHCGCDKPSHSVVEINQSLVIAEYFNFSTEAPAYAEL
jgi:hypothetical protein